MTEVGWNVDDGCTRLSPTEPSTNQEAWTYRRGTADVVEIREHLEGCGDASSWLGREGVEFSDYAEKICRFAITHEAWVQGRLAGLVAVYSNRGHEHPAYITHMGTLADSRRRGIAETLISKCLNELQSAQVRRVELEVRSGNRVAAQLLMRAGFRPIGQVKELVQYAVDLQV